MFICNICGNESLRWEGKCPRCQEWNSLVEFDSKKDRISKSWHSEFSSTPKLLSEINISNKLYITLSSDEINRVLGGGIVPGSVILLAGEPGIGKSTLLLGIADQMSKIRGVSLYVSGEESAEQVTVRAKRMGVVGDKLYILSSIYIQDLLLAVKKHKPELIIVDSIQTLSDQEIDSEPGSVIQIKECTRQLIQFAKTENIPVIISGHLNKSGDIAGPRVLEHMVDVVLQMEGEQMNNYRLVTTMKNRFGPSFEIGVFEINEFGLKDVVDPSRSFYNNNNTSSIGSLSIAALMGTRHLLVEIQSLTSNTVFGAPRRVSTGVDYNRMLLVCAVLSRRANISLSGQDIAVNIAGGLKVNEPAADLGMALAITSNILDIPLPNNLVAIGEVGLAGEIRPVPQIEKRINEVIRLGVNKCLIPKNKNLSLDIPDSLSLYEVSNINDAIAICLK
jgi:DNA repair protein RadA/Sms